MNDHTSHEEPVVVIEGLSKQFGNFTALEGLSLTIPRGAIVGLIGPNGAGKSTAIRILVGLLRPSAGTARIAGADCVTEAKRIRHLVGYMPDRFGSYDNMRVHEYLDFFGAAFGIPRRRRIARIDEVMETTGTTYMRDKFVESLSHGMSQRLGIARTMLHDPDVLILDEPANGLDPQARIEMRELLLRLASMGKALLVTSHILPELSRICDRVAILIQGKLRAFGTVAEIGRQVTQQRTIEVQLADADHTESAERVLRAALPEGTEITTAAAEAVVRFRTAGAEAELAGLLAQLVEAKAGVTQFRELQTDLEEAYMRFAAPNSANGS